jgi:hypothetical protein
MRGGNEYYCYDKVWVMIGWLYMRYGVHEVVIRGSWRLIAVRTDGCYYGIICVDKGIVCCKAFIFYVWSR